MPVAHIAAINLECADPIDLARFWAGMLDGELAVETPGFCAIKTNAIHLGAVGSRTTRQLNDDARGKAPALDHLLENPDAHAEMLPRDTDSTAARLEGALDRARDNDVWIGADLLLAQLVEVNRCSGNASRARQHTQQLNRIAGVPPTRRAAMHVRFGWALADDDAAEAVESLRLAREDGQPPEFAHVGLRLALAGLVEPAELLEISEILTSD